MLPGGGMFVTTYTFPLISAQYVIRSKQTKTNSTMLVAPPAEKIRLLLMPVLYYLQKDTFPIQWLHGTAPRQVRHTPTGAG